MDVAGIKEAICAGFKDMTEAICAGFKDMTAGIKEAISDASKDVASINKECWDEVMKEVEEHLHSIRYLKEHPAARTAAARQQAVGVQHGQSDQGPSKRQRTE